MLLPILVVLWRVRSRPTVLCVASVRRERDCIEYGVEVKAAFGTYGDGVCCKPGCGIGGNGESVPVEDEASLDDCASLRVDCDGM